MSLRSFYNLLLQTSVVTLFVYSALTVSFAQVRTSPSYQLQSDSVNFGGGLSTSTWYSLESTAGEVATGDGDSATYSLRAGYQQMQEVFLSLTGGDDVVMSPALGGLTGGTANGSTSVSVLTDSPGGYELSIASENAPAMQKGVDSLADYVSGAAPNADYAFNTASADAHFGFSPEGSDIVAYFRDNNAGVCGSGSFDNVLACWDGLSTSDTPIAQGGANQPTGATTTIHFRVGIGGTAGVIAGTYVATTTITAIPL
jgi:hypothetical protein